MTELFTKVNMIINQDPATLFEQISAIQNRHNNAARWIDEEDLIAQFLILHPRIIRQC
jgi:hypothetical protein